MPSSRRKKSIDEVLRYQKFKQPNQTVRKHFLAWRTAQSPPIPERCDNEHCEFHTKPLIWNGKPFQLILDHKNGNNSDNRLKNLRFLCPNCDAQLDTRGGKNKGRVEKSDGGFAIVGKDKKRHYTLPAGAGRYALSGQKAELTGKKRDK